MQGSIENNIVRLDLGVHLLGVNQIMWSD